MDYTSVKEKLTLSPRMEEVYKDILPRLKDWKSREDTTCSEVNPGEKNPFLDEFIENPKEAYVINLANAIVRSWLETPIVIHPNEALVGITRPIYPFMEHFSWGIRHRGYHAENHTQDYHQLALIAEAIERMTPLDAEHRYRAAIPVFGEKVHQIRKEGLFSAGGYQGHTIPNYETLLNLGLDGVLEKLERYEKINTHDADLYTAWKIIVRGMSSYLEQYAAEADRLQAAETDNVQRKYYTQIRDNCAYVAHQKPRTLYQAIQLMWCLSLWDWVDCLGRIDQYLFPYYQKAKAEGDVVSPEDSIVSIVFKLWENGSHNSTLSGCKPEDGSDATNELTFLFLQILRRIHDVHPRMAVRVQENIDPQLLKLIVQMWSEGMCDPSIVSDTCVIPALQRLNVTLADARNYATLGCQEIEVPGKSNLGCEDGTFNVAKALEIAMLGGMSTKDRSLRIGPKTKPFLECETFEELYESFQAQMAYFIPIFAFIANRGQEERAANHAKLVKGIFTDGCVEKGLAHDNGGPIYGYGVVETAGAIPAADALTAIKKLVFVEKKITKERLWEALENNFAGYEKERQMLLNFAPKFGNDDDTADAMACRVLNTFWDEIAKYRSVRGGPFTGACSLLSGGVTYGKHMGAMADGRFAQEPLGSSMGPRPGADKSGLTAMLSSVAKLPLHKGIGGTTLNVQISKKFLSDEQRRAAIAHTIMDYMVRGGQLVQVTTANPEDLLDAKVHPERHGDLIVRVGGFSIQFVQLSEAVQDEIISRYQTENQ